MIFTSLYRELHRVVDVGPVSIVVSELSQVLIATRTGAVWFVTQIVGFIPR